MTHSAAVLPPLSLLLLGVAVLIVHTVHDMSLGATAYMYGRTVW